jgi:hypothetical protein
MATATRPDLGLAQRFVDALGAANWNAVRGLLAEDVRVRALVPARLLEAEVEPIANQVCVRYRLAGTDRDDGRVVVEQQCCVSVEDGLITTINSVCSGLRPADSLR